VGKNKEEWRMKACRIFFVELYLGLETIP